jgi:predicted metal-dependent phosphoesterase TrpH
VNAAAPGIDLHLHTTASDGQYSPAALVARAAAAGVRILSVTDHDTTAAWREASQAAAARGLSFVPGIEITSVHGGRDIHVLGYYLDEAAPGFQAFLERQRRDRVRRLFEMRDRLERLGMRIELPDLGEASPQGRAFGRPLLADALVSAGAVPDRRAAFERWIGEGRPAFVPRRGPSPVEAIGIIADAGGVASLAHPALVRDDAFVEELAAGGRLPAIEVFHSEHDRLATDRYLALARRFNLIATGGSDFHGDQPESPRTLGAIHVPLDEFRRLESAATRRAALTDRQV